MCSIAPFKIEGKKSGVVARNWVGTPPGTTPILAFATITLNMLREYLNNIFVNRANAPR